MHPLSHSGNSEFEKKHPAFVAEGLREARRRSWILLEEMALHLKPGIRQSEAVILAESLARAQGVKKNWHKPIIRFGKETLLTFRDKGNPDEKLEEENIFFIDIGPVWALPQWGDLEYEGDVGKTFSRGGPVAWASVAQASQELFDGAVAQWKSGGVKGLEIYGWLSDAAAKRGYELVQNVDGHRVSDFPHTQYSKARLAAMDFSPASDAWVLEVHLRDPKNQCGAFFEDILQD